MQHSPVSKILWTGFAAFSGMILVALAINLSILDAVHQQRRQLVDSSAPLIDAVNQMAASVTLLNAASRGYLLTRQTQFIQQYDDAVRNFQKSVMAADQLSNDPRDSQLISALKRQFGTVKQATDEQIKLVHAGQLSQANEAVLAAARLVRVAPDYAGMFQEMHRRQQERVFNSMATRNQVWTLALVLASILLVLAAGYSVRRIERSLGASIEREVRRTEAIVAGMSDGVMLVNSEGKAEFINPAGQKMLAKSDLGIPIDRQPAVYGFLSDDGMPMDPTQLPAATALSTGMPVEDLPMRIQRADRSIAISSSAIPLQEGRRTTGAIVTFRDVTEKRRLEEEMRLQARRAETLADAGAYFSSNIDPVWVTQAIAEKVAEVLGDWSAVILKSGDKELRVASIYHRDMASLGLAWSYIYRQPLVVGEGLIGQVVSTGFPSMMTNLRHTEKSHPVDTVSYHAPSMDLASLLILPLSTRRETLGALVIAANSPECAITEENLPLAELLSERAALAIENSKLYIDQVEARRKVEDLSRLKDEFLSIASHELRTPVTSIKGYTQLAKTLIREKDFQTSEEYLDIALDQIDRMSRLILELLDVSRIETGRLQIRKEGIEWPQFVQTVVRHYSAVGGRNYHVEVPPKPLLVSGDRDRLEQVLGNLIENAVKYSPDGTDVTVRVEERANQLITSVIDRGIGIPQDELSQVFERFHRGRQVSSTNYGGLGLGLYITRQIVERHGGDIRVESKEGGGTTFSFTLPAVSADAAANVTETASVS